VARRAFILIAAVALLAGWFFRPEKHVEAPRAAAPERVAAPAIRSTSVAAVNPAPDAPLPETAGYLAGKVLFHDGRPAAGAEVTAVGPHAIATAGADGAFAIDVMAGEQRLMARLDGETALMPRPVIVKIGAVTSGIVLTLAPAGGFHGVVLDDDDKPVAGVRITAGLPVGASTRHLPDATVSDSSGGYSLPGLPPGIYDLRARAEGVGEANLRHLGLTSGKSVRANLRLQRFGGLEGTVTDEAGHPIAQALVALYPHKEVVTSADGHYSFEGLRPLPFFPSAMWHEHGPAAREMVTIQSGKVVRLDFSLPAEGTVSGSVVDPNGKPAGDVALFFRGTRTANRTGTDDGGRYSVSLLAGDHEVRAGNGERSVGRVTVRAGETTELNLTLDEERKAPLAITGVVLDESGKPAPGVAVSLRHGTGAIGFDGDSSETTDDGGRFELRTYRDGLFTVSAHGGGRSGSAGGVKPGAEVVLKLSATANVSGHVRGVHSDSFEVTAAGSVARFSGDEFLLTDLPAGQASVKVRDGQHASGSAEVLLEAGETADVTISLVEKRPVAVTVVDEKTLKPVADASLSGGDPEERALTDAAGSATVYLAPDQRQLSIEAGRYQRLTVPVAQDSLAVVLSPLAPGGVGLSWNYTDHSRCLVDRVLDGGPAAKAGVRSGDVVYAVDGMSVTDAEQAVNLVRGAVGEPVTLLVRRDGAAMSFTLVRVDLATLPQP
jgi:PDZ domain/Carboxypeptidase regulatory-like domain